MLLVLLAATCFGSLGVLSRTAYAAGMAPPAFVAWRATIGAISLVAFATLVGHGRRWLSWSAMDRRTRLALAVAAIVGTILNMALFAAFQRTTIALALLGFYTYPALVAAVGPLLGHERLDRTRLVALGLALGGMAAVVLGGLDPASGLRADAVGIGLALGAAVSQAIFVLVSRNGYASVPTAQVMAIVLACAGGLAAIATLVVNGTDALLLPFRDVAVVGPILLAGIVAAGLSSYLFLLGIRWIGGVRTGILMLWEPVVGVALAAIFLSEPVVPIQAGGGLAIIAAAAVLQRGAADDTALIGPEPVPIPADGAA